MSYNLKKGKVFVGNKHRIFFKHKNVANYFCSFLYPLAIFLGFFITFTIVAPALANDKTNFSAFSKEEIRRNFSLTQTKNSLQPKATSYCRALLQKNLSQNVSTNKKTSTKTPALHGRNRAPVALGIYLGMRHALGPTEGTNRQVNNKRFVQSSFGMQVKASNSPHALAIAAYRTCEKERSLKAMLPRSI